MLFRSTTGRAPSVDLATALLSGPAPDGGLYLPEQIETLPPSEVESLENLDSLASVALPLARRLFGEDLFASPEDLASLLDDALDFPVPLREIEADRFVLELFRGPTLAFKDVGARVMARLLRRSLEVDRANRGRKAAVEQGRDSEPVQILVATSGDTGSAVARAFFQLEPFQVVVLFPRGKISEGQRKLFSTLGEARGGNVTSLAVEGTFDDCQAMVKKAFADQSLREKHRLASANSINVGRFLPQSFYYFWIRAQLPAELRSRPLVVSVPSGNFGNLTSGVIALRLGAKIDRLIAATNVNDIVPAYLESGLFEPRPSLATISNAMDVGNPSNFVRLLDLFGGDRRALREKVEGHAFDDQQTSATIGEVYRRTGYRFDPHSAVGWLGLDRGLEAARQRGASNPLGVVLATAHPAKFPRAVEEATGEPVELPPALRDCLERPESVTEIPAEYPALKAILEQA